MSVTYGVVALARPTFDVEYAEAMKNEAFAALERAGIAVVGSKELAFDADAARSAFAAVAASPGVDLLLIMQVTFTDASMTVELAGGSEKPVAIWAFPEPRAGGRLRLNALCGLNLACHALGRAGLAYDWLFAAPDDDGIEARLRELASPRELVFGRARRQAGQPGGSQESAVAAAGRARAALQGARIALIGHRPDGFDTCQFDADELRRLAGVDVAHIPVQEAFARARSAGAERVEAHLQRVGSQLTGLQAVDSDQLERSLRLLCAFEDIARDQGAGGMAVRCWPETFTDYGCAACGPMAMLTQAGVPCACEADVYGTLSTLMLKQLADEPVWMADLVDLDTSNNTAVLWHCGLAPLSMCDPEVKPEATIHTNRKMPLLHQFPLKPGRITILRVSQARNETQLVIAGAEVLKAPMSFTGTSGVIRFDAHAEQVGRMIMDEGLEHHFALAYGDHREALLALARQLELPVLALGPLGVRDGAHARREAE